MTKLRQHLEQLHDDERGSVSVLLIAIVIVLVAVVGLVVDGSGKYQASQSAQMIAASAARAGTNAVAGEAIINGDLSLDNTKARTAAENYLTAAGLTGTVTAVGNTITVSVKSTYTTKFLSLIAINNLPIAATSSAQIITQ